METPEVSSSEMTPDPPKRLLSVKSASSPSSKTSSPQSRTKMVKISSADSLLAMFKSLGMWVVALVVVKQRVGGCSWKGRENRGGNVGEIDRSVHM